MDDRSLARISRLTQLSRERELTREELQERKVLREAYIKAFRGQFRAQLDHTVVRYPDGSSVFLKDAAKKKDN